MKRGRHTWERLPVVRLPVETHDRWWRYFKMLRPEASIGTNEETDIWVCSKCERAIWTVKFKTRPDRADVMRSGVRLDCHFEQVGYVSRA